MMLTLAMPACALSRAIPVVPGIQGVLPPFIPSLRGCRPHFNVHACNKEEHCLG